MIIKVTAITHGFKLKSFMCKEVPNYVRYLEIIANDENKEIK